MFGILRINLLNPKPLTEKPKVPCYLMLIFLIINLAINDLI